MIKHNAVECLMMCISSPDVRLHEAAVVVLGTLARIRNGRNCAWGRGGGTAGCAAAQRSTPSCQAVANEALTKLATSPHHSEVLVQKQAVVPLVRHLRGDAEAQPEMAATALAHIASGGGKCVEAIIRTGAVDILVRLLSTPAAPAMQACSCVALAALAVSLKGCKALLQAGAMPSLVRLLASEHEECQWQATCVLACLAKQGKSS